MNQYIGIAVGNCFIWIPVVIVLTLYHNLDSIYKFGIMFLPSMIGLLIMINSILMHEDKPVNKITERSGSQ